MYFPGTSPHTYASGQVRPGDNQVRVRAKCLGQTSSGIVKVLKIGECVRAASIPYTVCM